MLEKCFLIGNNREELADRMLSHYFYALQSLPSIGEARCVYGRYLIAVTLEERCVASRYVIESDFVK